MFLSATGRVKRWVANTLRCPPDAWPRRGPNPLPRHHAEESRDRIAGHALDHRASPWVRSRQLHRSESEVYAGATQGGTRYLEARLASVAHVAAHVRAHENEVDGMKMSVGTFLLLSRCGGGITSPRFAPKRESDQERDRRCETLRVRRIGVQPECGECAPC